MATVLAQPTLEGASARLNQLIEALKSVEGNYSNINKKREEAINNLYKYAVIENKELTHKQAVSLIKDICKVSRATVYNYLNDDYKRKYDKHGKTSESLKVRQLRKWTKAEVYENVKITATHKQSKSKTDWNFNSALMKKLTNKKGTLFVIEVMGKSAEHKASVSEKS